MYCTRTDIEQKRLAREHLLDLVDDERTGEFYDGADAEVPDDNTLPLYSDTDSVINTRVRECIEDADNEINASLSGIYAVPIGEGQVPAIVNTLSVNISTYYLYVRRGIVPDSIKELYGNAIGLLKRIETRRVTLLIPKVDDPEIQTQSAYAVRTRPKVFDNLPY